MLLAIAADSLRPGPSVPLLRRVNMALNTPTLVLLFMIIPYQSLSSDVLQNIIEEYISREGTDYGEYELSLEQKVQRLLPQVKSGEVLIVFDEITESVQLLPKADYGRGQER